MTYRTSSKKDNPLAHETEQTTKKYDTKLKNLLTNIRFGISFSITLLCMPVTVSGTGLNCTNEHVKT